MSKEINVILIDPHKHEITEVTLENNEDPTAISDLLDCRLFDVVHLGSNVIMYIDDEGLLIDNKYFKLQTKEQQRCFAGKSILACDDGHGNTISFDRSINTVKKITTWMPAGYKEEPFMHFVSF